MKIILMFIILMPFQIYGQQLCDPSEIYYLKSIPENMRWSESDVTKEAADKALDYIEKLVAISPEEYHGILYNNAQKAIEGYVLKQWVLKIKKGEALGGPVEEKKFCEWLGRSAKSD